MSLTRLEEKRNLDAISHDKDGHLILGASSLNTRYWSGSLSYYDRVESAPKEPTASAELDSGITDVKWIPDSGRIAACSDSGAVSLWKVSPLSNSLSCLSVKTEHDDIVSSIAINSSGSKFVSTSYDRSVTIWDTEEFTPVSHFTGHSDIVRDAAFHTTHPDIFISCSQDGRVLVWDLRNFKPSSVIDFKSLMSLPTSVAWQPGSEDQFAVGTETGEIYFHDRRTDAEDPIKTCVHSRLIHRIAFSTHRSNWLASVSHDCTAAVTEFDSAGGAVIYRDWSHKDFVQGLSWNPINNFLTTCSWDSSVSSRQIPEVKDETAVSANRMEIEQASA